MGRGGVPREQPPADQPATAAISTPVVLAKGYRPYHRFHATLPGGQGRPVAQQRDLLRGGAVAAVLPVDLERDQVVLIRQFRLSAQLALGLGDMVEIVAGRVEAAESPADAARRECLEEIGVSPEQLVELCRYLPTPGLTDELVILFLGAVDASRIHAAAVSAGEQEDIRPLRVGIEHALAVLDGGAVHSGLTLIALQWLALNRHRLDALMRPR
jgi:ADP-ribose pyrophosphatase